MRVYAGIDEAGYGPMFGPLTVGCAVFRFDSEESVPAGSVPMMWSMLRSAVCREVRGAKGRIAVNDSKKLKRGNPAWAAGRQSAEAAAVGGGASGMTVAGAKVPAASSLHPLEHLERGVLAFAKCLSSDGGAGGGASGGVSTPTTMETDREVFDLLSPGLSPQLHDVPWYGSTPTAVPVAVDAAAIGISANVLRRALARAGVHLAKFDAKVMTEGVFNQQVNRLRSKAAVSFHLVGQHLAQILDRFGTDHPNVIVDHQGARSQYRVPLQTLFPEAAIRIMDEREDTSTYELAVGARQMTVMFVESAEAAHFPVALASMLAKYLRELLMIRFNRYFAAERPGIRPTAGYVEDGRRFLAEIEPVIRERSIRRDQLVRSR